MKSLKFQKMLHKMRSENPTERKQLNYIQIKEETQSNSKNCQSHMRLFLTQRNEKFTINTEKKD